MCHFIVCSSQFKAEYRLEIFSFQEDFAFESVAEVRGVGEGCFFDDFVDAGGEDEAEIL
jgi:hypothetical protein